MRSIAMREASTVPKLVRRKKCSPDGPKPEPGVQMTLASVSMTSKKSQLVMPSGVLSQTYWELTPP